MTTTPPVQTMSLTLKALRVHRRGPVLSVQLHEPDQGNLVSDAMLDDLLAVLDSQAPEVRVLVLSGAGQDFSLGGDRSEFAEHLLDDPTGGRLRASGVKGRRVCDALISNPAVTIARVQGRAIGAGFALALACDLRVGTESTTFRLPELTLGLPATWGGLLPRLIQEIGAARVRDIVLTSRPLGATEAQSLSLLQKVVPAEDLDAAVDGLTKAVLRRPAHAYRVTKTLLNSYAAAGRLADATALDPELMAAVAAETHRPTPSTPQGPSTAEPVW
ncbi:enoyl-CoA hydratase/isomerase family protein [Streptomyces bauhiniae]